MGINFLAIVVVTIFNFALGAIWYSPVLFAKPFMGAIGKSEEELKKGSNNIMFVCSFFAALITTYILAHFVDFALADTFWTGMQTGVWAWLGFVAATHIAGVLFEGRNMKLYLIYIGYQLIAISISGGILAIWK
ncbi:MAG: DUF1761 domain-containing protein [Ignavibacteria bacterium]|nr:DUF1761 domain-containing protein [Ignavibacteria bacterium]